MQATTLEQDELLVSELHRLGVRHLARMSDESARLMPPAELLAALARHPMSRFNASLILLFLRRPDFSEAVSTALRLLDEPAALTLKLYYQAAVYLQRELDPQLRPYLSGWIELPDLFSRELNTPPADSIHPNSSSQPALAALGKVHRLRSGWNCDWAGSYRQYIPLFLRCLMLEARPHALTYS